MPQISVIVPVYNVEPYLRRCVDSILAQTFTDFELILIDDGSTDNSGAICDEYTGKDKRVKVIHNKNGGVSSARNAGISAAEGNFLCFVDSDDAVYKDYLESLYNPAFDLTVSGFETLTDDEKLLWKQKYSSGSMYAPSIDFYRLYKEYALYSPCGRIFRTVLIREHGLAFPLNISWGEDGMFVADYLQYVQSILVLNYVGYIYYKHDGAGSLSTVVRENTVDMVALSREYCIEKMKAMAPEQYEQIKKVIKEDITQNCAFFMRSLLENSQLTVVEKNHILEHYLNSPYIRESLLKAHEYYEKKSALYWIDPVIDAKQILKNYQKANRKAVLYERIKTNLYDPLPRPMKKALKFITK